MELKMTWRGLDQSFIDSLQESTTLALGVAFIIILITTRLTTGGSSSHRDGSKTPPLAPYWVPYFGHLPRILFNPSSALSKLRNRYSEGAFSIRLLGNVHTFVFRPSLSAALLQQPSSVADEQRIIRHLMVTNFGLSKNDLDAYDRAFSEVQEQNKQLLAESTQKEVVNATVKNLVAQLADLVSFNSYPTDHMEWERLAHAQVVEDNGKGETVMEADFMELTRNFIAKPATAAIFGTDFVENFPEIWPFLWTLDAGFIILALGVPMWVPWPRAQRARNARRKLLDFMYEFHTAMEKDMNGDDPGPRWYDLHNVSQLVRSRTEVFRKHKLPIEARAAYDVGLLWSLNAHSTPLISWSLLELYQDPVLLAQVRDEVAPFVKVVQPDNDFGGAVWVPPTIETIDLAGLMTKCPLLLTTYIETLRLYGGGWSVRWLKEDVVLEEGDQAGEKYVLQKGTYAHVFQDLHNSDRKSFPDWAYWQVRRHINESVDEQGATVLTVHQGSIEPYDGGLTLCNDSVLSLKKMLIFTSLLISLYEFEPAGSKSWIPSVSKGAVSSWPNGSVRVWIKRRGLAKS